MEDQSEHVEASAGERLYTFAVAGNQVVVGITYRHWLIGQALAGAAVHEGTDQAASDAIQMADKVISMLDAETARDTKTADMFEAEHQCCGGCK